MYNGLEYSVFNGEVTITKYTGSATEVVIPDQIEGYPVTTIGECAFHKCISLTSITIPDSVTTIGNSAFSSCRSLTRITIPDSVTAIGDYAFDDCTGLTGITLGSNITTIWGSAFSGCRSLISINIPDSVTTIGSGAFQECTSLTSVTFGSGLTTIESHAFSRCTNLQTVTIGDSITNVGINAFFLCPVTKLIVAEGSKTITSKMMPFGNSLQEVVIPNSVTTIADYAFWDCQVLELVHFTGTISQKNNIRFGDNNSYLFKNSWHCDCLYVDSEGQSRLYCPRCKEYLQDEIEEMTAIVVFRNWDGTILSNQTYRWGENVTVPADPTRPADNTYTYTFSGWDKEVVACAGDAAYTAIYIPTYINYSVVFKDWNGDVLSSKTYHYGDKVTLPADPTRAADKTYTYTFTGWDKEVVDCAGNVVYTAVYASDFIEYMVVFQYADGTQILAASYHYGDSVVIPEDPAAPEVNAVFVGWDKEITACAGNAVYTAVFQITYIPGDIDGNGEVNRDDVIALLLHVSMPAAFPISVPADFNGDGLITRDDVIQLLLHVSMPDAFPLNN